MYSGQNKLFNTDDAFYIFQQILRDLMTQIKYYFWQSNLILFHPLNVPEFGGIKIQ
jgi:hypothetical protein